MIVIFDGVCNFCNGWVRFVIKRDPGGNFSFAAAQSEPGLRMLDQIGLDPTALETIVLIDGPRHYEKSDAILQILRHLAGPWSALRALLVVPKRVRDAGYIAFARRRYRWFGKSEACPVQHLPGSDRFIL